MPNVPYFWDPCLYMAVQIQKCTAFFWTSGRKVYGLWSKYAYFGIWWQAGHEESYDKLLSVCTNCCVFEAFSTYPGFIVNLDPKKDGNCQFEAVADQLRLRVHSTSAGSQSHQTSATAAAAVTGMIVRQQVINYMTEFAENFIHFKLCRQVGCLCW